MDKYTKIKRELRNKILKKIDYSRSFSDEEIRELIAEEILSYGVGEYICLRDKEQMGKELFFSIRRLDVLQEILDDMDVTEIMVNGSSSIFLEKKGALYCSEYRFEEAEKLEDVIQQIVGSCNRVVNEASPIVDARLKDGSRVNVVMPPVALNGPILTIRRFPQKPILMKDLIFFQSLSKELAYWLQKLVMAKYNIFVSGGTGTGKTTFLNALSDYIPKQERVITIEDSAELQLQGLNNLVRLETRNANVDGCRAITIRDLIKASLRMRPDRIVVGETRGSEALDVLQAMGTGHDGSLSSGHANSASDMLVRLETMVLMGMDMPLPAIRRQIGSAIDLVIHLGRLRDRSRKVLEIMEVTGYNGEEIKTQSLYRFSETGEDKDGRVQGVWEKSGVLFRTSKLQYAGLTTDDP